MKMAGGAGAVDLCGDQALAGMPGRGSVEAPPY